MPRNFPASSDRRLSAPPSPQIALALSFPERLPSSLSIVGDPPPSFSTPTSISLPMPGFPVILTGHPTGLARRASLIASSSSKSSSFFPRLTPSILRRAASSTPPPSPAARKAPSSSQSGGLQTGHYLVGAGAILIALAIGAKAGQGVRDTSSSSSTLSPYAAAKLSLQQKYPPPFGSADDYLKGIEELRVTFGRDAERVSTDEADLEHHGFCGWPLFLFLVALVTADVSYVGRVSRLELPRRGAS